MSLADIRGDFDRLLRARFGAIGFRGIGWHPQAGGRLGRRSFGRIVDWIAPEKDLADAFSDQVTTVLGVALEWITRGANGLRQGTCPAVLSSEPRSGAGFCLRGLFFPILRRCMRFKRTEKTGRHSCDLIDCSAERAFVCLRWFVESSDLSHELE